MDNTNTPTYTQQLPQVSLPSIPVTVQALIEQGKFYLRRVTDGSTIEVFGVERDGRYIIADEEGLRKLVVAHVEGCECGEQTDYIIPSEVIELCLNEHDEQLYQTDLQLLGKYRDLILNQDMMPEYEVSDYVVYRDDRCYDGETNDYDLPPLGSLILVTAITKATTGEWVMTGYTGVMGRLTRVSGEAWRFVTYKKTE